MKYILLSTLIGFSTAATATNYTASSAFSDTHNLTKYKLHEYAKRVKDRTNGNITFDVHSGGVLLPAKSALSGITNGVAQYGHVTGAYVPADLRYDNVLNDLAFVVSDPMAAAIATTEVKLTNDILQKEYLDNKAVFGSSYSMTNYYMICREPVLTAADVKSKRIRTGSTAQVQWTQYMGGVPVSMPATEIYTGLQRGSIDCALGDASFLTTSFKLQEVGKHVTLVSVGTHTSGGEFFNKDFWNNRTVEERKLLLDELAMAIAELQVVSEAEAEKSLEEAKGNGVKFYQPSEDLQQAVDKFQNEYVESLPAASIKSRKVEDPSEIIQQYLSAEEKWEDLLSKIDRTDVNAVAKLIREQLYNNINYEQYGIQ